MAEIAIFRINYKSDFILTLRSDAGWMTPFCIKFWTGAPSQAYYVGYDGSTYSHCAPDPEDPTKLNVQFDNHGLPIGDLKFQIGYHFTVADFPTSVEDEVLNQASVIIEVDDAPAQVMLDFNGETAPEIEFSLPAYANEAQRIANEEQRIAAESQRISNEEARIAAEQARQQNEQQRINNEALRVQEFARLKTESQEATSAANAAAALAAAKAQLAADKAALAQAAATLAGEKAQLAADKAALADAAATLANAKAALAQQKAEYANTQGTYAKAQGDYAKAQGDYAKAQGDIAQADHQRAEEDHTTAAADHATAVEDHRTAGFDHTLSNADHILAGQDHTTAAADHETAAADHTQAASDHNTAAADHETAASDHTLAASDHETAAADHERAENDHTVIADAAIRAQNAAEEAATNAQNAAEEATAASESANRTEQYLQELEDAIQNLPDGQAVSAQVATNTVAIAQLKSIVQDLETIAEGYIRVAGSSSPALSYKSYKYHEQGGFGRESVFSLFYPCLIGTKLSGDDTQVGKILHILQKLGAETVNGVPMWRDIYGVSHAIDGSEGDIMVCNVEPYYQIAGKHTIEGTLYDVFLVSRTPFTFQGIEAEHIERAGMSPDYVVSHKDADEVTRMHSVYNPAWAGSYQAPGGVAGKYVYSTDPDTGDITEIYDENTTLLGGSGGLHTTDLQLPTGEQRAMNHNPDTTKTIPFMNSTAEMCNRLFSLMLAEGGTFNAHAASLMGSGFSCNDAATSASDWTQDASGAKNGMRVENKDGDWKYYSLGGNVKFLFGQTTGTRYAAECINTWRNPWHIMEAYRAVSYAVKHDVHELEWFEFEGNKYKYRSVSGFNDIGHGEATCVVWKLIATQAGAAAIDPTDLSTSIAGNRVEFLISTCLFHGITTQVSPSWWTSGLIFTEDENGQYECFFERDQAELVKSTAAENYDPATPRDFEERYEHVLTVSKGEGYAKDYLNGVMMLPASNASKGGGALHTYVGKYNWFTGTNASAGKKSVRGFRRGISAAYAILSPLTGNAFNAPSNAFTDIGFGTCCRIVD